jgi:hypothetical protein
MEVLRCKIKESGVCCVENVDLSHRYVYMQEPMQSISTVEPGYNDTGFCDTSLIPSDILWFQLIPHC